MPEARPFDIGDRAEVIGSESVFVTVKSDAGLTGMRRVAYLHDERTLVFKSDSLLRHLDDSLNYHLDALRELAKLLGEDKLARALDYVAPHVVNAVAALAPTDKAAV
jgi:hypothetical protein